MHALIVNFELDGLDDAEFRRLCDQVAPVVAAVPGLIAKTWLADPATNSYGGVYLFANREALDGYLASEIVAGLKTDPHFANLTTRTFGVFDAPTRLTYGPLPLDVAA